MQFFTTRHHALHIVIVPVMCCLLATQAQAGSASIFPASRPADPLTPINPATLPPLAKPVVMEETAPPSRGPLKVVIPNIKTKKETAKAKKPTPAPKAVARKKIKPSPPKVAQKPTPSSQVSVLPDGKKPNGVIVDTAGLIPHTQYSNVTQLLEVPLAWIVNQSGRTHTAPAPTATALSQLEPAAGGNTPQPLIGTPPQEIVHETFIPNGVIIDPMPAGAKPASMAARAKPIVPIQPKQPATPVKPPKEIPALPAAPPPAFEPSGSDPTEPRPTISAQSKAILDRLPAEKQSARGDNTAGKFAIDRERENPNFGGDVQVSAHESRGMRVDIKRNPVDVSYELEKAYNALIAGNSDSAIRIYEDVLTNDMNNEEALFGLASTYHRVGQIDLARSLYGKLLQRNPRHRDGLNNFLVLLADEAPEEALRHMEQLEKKNPGFSPIPAQMAIIYKNLGQSDRAVDKMYQALALSPENVTYRYNLAIMLDQMGEQQKAASLYEQVLKTHDRGIGIPGDAKKIQQRLTFIRSNTP